MHVLVTGSNGFIGKNLLERLSLLDNMKILTFTREDTFEMLKNKIKKADFIFHLAGINRPDSLEEFYEGNRDLTKIIVNEVIKYGKKIPILITSSIQAERDNDYGKSKLEAENILKKYHRRYDGKIYIYRLPNVFGKWCKPNYNSVVATWCYNIVNSLEVQVNDKLVSLNLVYIGDVVESFIKHLDSEESIEIYYEIKPSYQASLGQIYELLFSFKEQNILFDNLEEFDKKIYLTYKNYEEEKEAVNAKL